MEASLGILEYPIVCKTSELFKQPFFEGPKLVPPILQRALLIGLSVLVWCFSGHSFMHVMYRAWFASAWTLLVLGTGFVVRMNPYLLSMFHLSYTLKSPSVSVYILHNIPIGRWR